MRTLDDLRDAFEMLERSADSYSADVVPLQSVRAVRRRHRPSVWLTAAAVAAALAVTGTVVWNATRTGGPTQSGGAPAPLTAEQLTVPFRLASDTGLTVVQTQVGGGQAFNLADRSHMLQLMLSGSQGQPYASSEPVDINGATGRYTDEANESHPPMATRAPGATAPPEGPWPREITWRYKPGAWATLQTQAGPTVSKSELLRIARGIDFTVSTELRSPMSVAAAPDALELTQVNLMPRAVGEEPPFDLKTTTWYADLMYTSADHRFGVEINATAAKRGNSSGLSVGPWTKDATSVRVGTRSGYWSSSLNTLSVQLGDDSYLNILQTGAGGGLSESQLVDIARTVTVVPEPQDRSTWLDAAKALALH